MLVWNRIFAGTQVQIMIQQFGATQQMQIKDMIIVTQYIAQRFTLERSCAVLFQSRLRNQSSILSTVKLSVTLSELSLIEMTAS